MTGNWTAIIINYNGSGFIEACVQALENCTLRPAEILVVDNDSTDDSLLEMNGFPRVQVLAQHRNLGFGGGANVGLAAVETDYAVVLNPDVEVEPSFGNALVETFDANRNLGAAGSMLIFPDSETIQHAGGEVNWPLCTTYHHHHGAKVDSVQLVARDVGYVTGGAMALRMTAVRQVGGFDEMLSPVYYEDVDLCLELHKAGWAIRFEPALRALHHEGSTLKRSPAYFQLMHRNRVLFARKHLSAHDWATGFVPAELERLRYELNNLDGIDGLTIAGANSIESLARSMDIWDGPAVLTRSRTTLHRWPWLRFAQAGTRPVDRRRAGILWHGSPASWTTPSDRDATWMRHSAANERSTHRLSGRWKLKSGCNGSNWPPRCCWQSTWLGGCRKRPYLLLCLNTRKCDIATEIDAFCPVPTRQERQRQGERQSADVEDVLPDKPDGRDHGQHQ